MSEKEKFSPTSFIKWIGDMTEIISQHGIVKVLSSIFILTIATCVLTIAINPKFLFDKFIHYQEEKEITNRAFRKQSDPLIRAEITEILYSLDAERVSIFEFHNGRKNPSSLGFYYAEITYEQTKKDVESINAQYKSINLSLLNLSTLLCETGHWHGSTKQLAEIDQNIANAIERNGTNYIGFNLLESNQELGLLIISFKEEPDWNHVDRYLKRSCSKITTLLSFKQ